jgi:predicted nuclease of predicted toxin-antitoxin system
VKFLIDECLSARIVGLLADAGHDVVHVEERDLKGHIDDEVLELARVEGRILLCADTDFGGILARSGAALPSFILFRQGNRSLEHRAATLLDNLAEIAADLAAGAVVVFADDRIRIRRLPVRYDR